MDQGPIDTASRNLRKLGSDAKNRKDRVMNVMTKSNPTLTQSGLLAVLLQRQRYKVIQLTRRRARRKQMRAAFWNALNWPLRALTTPTAVNDSDQLLVRTVLRRI
jgi:hypothetical protein